LIKWAPQKRYQINSDVTLSRMTFSITTLSVMILSLLSVFILNDSTLRVCLFKQARLIGDSPTVSTIGERLLGELCHGELCHGELCKGEPVFRESCIRVPYFGGALTR
jgi:hypothetical protein